MLKILGGVGAALLLISAPAPGLAHGGGLNAEGCHNNRKTGDYHCHRGSGRSSPAARSTSSSRRSTGAYANCTAARAAGASNIRRGEPGYGPHLDRDDDGIACER